MFGNFFASLLGKAIGVGVILALVGGGALWAGKNIKGCVRGQDNEATREKAEEKTQAVQEADKKSDEKIKEMTNEELRNYGRTGVFPERLRR